MPPTMSTTTTTTFSNTSGHRRKGSGELDVFEASRYFSGDIDSLALGFGAWRSTTTTNNNNNNNNIDHKMSLELIPTKQQAILPLDHQKKHKSEKKTSTSSSSSCKPVNSPSAKLANYLNSFLLQRSSKKKSIHSKSKSTTNMQQSLKKINDDDDHHHLLHHHESISFRSYSDCSKSYSYSSSGFGTPTQHGIERRIINGDQYWFSDNNHYWKRDVGDEAEVEDDGETSDSSSDLFELRNMEAAIGDGPSELPVYGTSTAFEVLKREVAIATSIVL